jgi:ATP/maltotriose-dependent transcriptional regulator MalT
MNLGELITGFEGVTAGLELVDASLDFARRCGLTHHVMWSRTSRLYYLYELGLWDELLREADEVARWDRGQGGGSQIEVWSLIASAPVRAQRGSPDEARRDAVTFLPRAREVADPQMLIPALVHAALVSAASGELDEAVALAQEFERTFVRAVTGFNYPVLPTILRICVAAGELTLAQGLVDVTAEVAVSPLLLHSTTTGRAILADAHGKTDEAAALYRAAAAAWDEWGSVPERAYALLGLGRCGDGDAAREAAAIFERLGASPVLARAA